MKRSRRAGSYLDAVVDSFSGMFEGLDHTASNLTISGSGNAAGLIGTLYPGVTMRDIVHARNVTVGPVTGASGYDQRFGSDQWRHAVGPAVDAGHSIEPYPILQGT